MWPRGRQNLRFRSLTNHIDVGAPCTVLDYGCGLAHLREFLLTNRFQASYIGVDIVPEFVASSAKRHPESTFFLASEDGSLEFNVDHVVASGTFNIIEGDYDNHWRAVRGALLKLFDCCSESLAVNFMTDQVDFQQDGAFHIAPAVVVNFIGSSLSRRFSLDQTYMPYEYTVVAYKNARILRPDNVFE